uniref:Epsin 2 n=1 Tax=Oryctolagus cuniculus TaxID=9986 RepID=G1SFD5_RABIT
MTTSSIRRQMKNIVNNYSEAEIKVREATSNDPWGPSSSLMTEIADLTYNVVAFSEIMSMVWKRLNDHGKNWRHVYKALTLLDYLIKTGSERVAQQCRENIFAIQTLKDFQYIDRDGKDQGVNVREKSKQLVALLKDEERLKAERAQALKTKERMAQVATGMGSNQITFGRGSSQPNLSTSYSEQEYGKAGGSPASYHGCAKPAASVDPWGVPTGTSAHTVPKSSDPWAASQQPASGAGKTADAWGAASATKPMSASGSFELFSNLNGTVKDDFSEFDNLRTSKKAALANSPSEAPPPTSATSCPATPQGARLGDPQSRLWAQPPPMAEPAAPPPSQNNGTTSPDPFESQPLPGTSSKPSSARKTPESFLGPNAALV